MDTGVLSIVVNRRTNQVAARGNQRASFPNLVACRSDRVTEFWIWLLFGVIGSLYGQIDLPFGRIRSLYEQIWSLCGQIWSR